MSLDLGLTSINTKQDYWEELKQYLNKDINKDLIYRCYILADNAHKNQLRESGEAYISHLVWIAKVVAQLNIGQEAILAALLHDCVEDTDIKIEKIAEEFGDEVALIVEGLTEVHKNTSHIVVNQTSIEVFRKFLFSSVNDVRVLIIRLVDKLHNGFTIEYLNEERKVRYAKNIMGIYAPIAEYVGLHYFKKLLEDIAFRILKPDEAEKLEKLLKERANGEIKAMAIVKNDITKMLSINNINDFEIIGRIKGLYSTYQKIKMKGEERVKDRIGIRILTSKIADCYTVLGLLHSKYEYLSDEFDDYISCPKPNGYRSIQTTLLWKDYLTLEVQIRTKEMHDFNEFGPASHIVYKLGEGINVGYGMEWVRDLIKWQTNENEIKTYKLKVLTNFIYVFTPKGDTIQMPMGSTALDFAYRIHEDVGNYCKGVKINKKIAKIDTVLKTGDLLEILVGKKMNVNSRWLDIAKTGQAKTHIRKRIKSFLL